MSKYPEHEKLRAISDQSQACGEFMVWLAANGFVIGQYHTHTDECNGSNGWPICGKKEILYETALTMNDLLAQRFGIDQRKLDTEKRTMLDELRSVGVK